MVESGLRFRLDRAEMSQSCRAGDVMSKALPREQKKNSDCRSEVTCLGTPCLKKTCRTNRVARSLEVQ